MNIPRFISEVARSPYYRSHLGQAVRLAHAKWELAKHRVADPRQFLERLGINPDSALKGLQKWRPLLDDMLSKVRNQPGQHGGISQDDGAILFALARTLKPQVVIETGIAAGVSTAFLGAALIENEYGKLFSIELPPNDVEGQRQTDGVLFDWPKLGVAWAVPHQIWGGLKDRHVMLLEDVRSALPRLLKEVQSVDLFFHDDLHEPDHMYSQYALVWPYLRYGGSLVSDDVNFGWLKFAKQHSMYDTALQNIQRLAVLRKY